MEVEDCNWRNRKCYENKESVVDWSGAKEFPAKDGWMQVIALHYHPVIIQMKKDGEKLLLRWHDKGLRSSGTALKGKENKQTRCVPDEKNKKQELSKKL